MKRYLYHPLMFLALLLLAFWPVWRWYAMRIADGSGEGVGLMALLTVVALVLRQSLSGSENARFDLKLPAILLLVYLCTLFYLPPLLRAVIAVLAIACLISRYWFNRHFHPGIGGLLLLCLPLMASLQFYVGYPMRVLIGHLTIAMLNLNGFNAYLEGVTLHWADSAIVIDAPCSGIKMLWVGLYLCFTLVCLMRLNTAQGLLLVLAAIFSIIMGNALRASALFFTESGIINAGPWMHNGVGMICFILTALAIMLFAHLIKQRSFPWRPVSI